MTLHGLGDDSLPSRALNSAIGGPLQDSLPAAPYKDLCMQLQAEKTSLVITGAWNPAIVTPNWIAEHILKIPADKPFQVQVTMPVNELGLPSSFRFEQLALTAHGGALIFHLTPDSHEQVAKTFNVAGNVLSILTHTPVTGVGVNFEYAVEKTGKLDATFVKNNDLVGYFDEKLQPSLGQQSWQATVVLTDHQVNVQCVSAAGSQAVLLNHHFNVFTAKAGAAIINAPDLFWSLKEMSDSLVKQLEGDPIHV
jgi:hypothetical protein